MELQRGRGVGRSDVGRTRAQNEDSFAVDDELGLYVVSDGMGGHAGGEIASKTAVEAAVETVREADDERAGVASGKLEPRALAALAERAAVEANRRVFELATSPEGQSGMGCTLTVLLIAGPVAAMAHVGDSRLYLVRGKGVSQLSQDHTVGAEMARSGMLAPEDIDNSPYSGVLARAVGVQPAVKVETLVIETLPNDVFLLCSDGYSKYLERPSELAEIVASVDIDDVAARLVDEANRAGGEDNITVVLAEVESVDEQTERVTAVGTQLDALQSVFLFQHLDYALLARVREACRLDYHDTGDVVMEAGDTTRALLVVVQGSYELSVDGAKVGSLAAGDYAGATTLFEPRPARSTMTASEPSMLLRLGGKRFFRLIRERPWLGIGLLERLGTQLSTDLERSFAQREGSGEQVADGERL